MKTSAPNDLGRHGRRSRVIWHPGSTPPYSSLWITIQRFLMLNQPTRAAFTHDFLTPTASATKVPPAPSSPRQALNRYQIASTQSPVRLTRFARVLKESIKTFHCCHIGQFSNLVRPYFGDFAVCHDCLVEGFHSILYSFDGLRDCPVHGTRLQGLADHDTVASGLFTNALGNPFASCQNLRQVLGWPVARKPKSRAQRDLALGEIADWLLDVGSRCWLGPPRGPQAESFDAFTNRLVRLRTALKLPHATPLWADAIDHLAHNSTGMEIATLGSLKMRPEDLVNTHDRRAHRHQTYLGIYSRTILGDFKAIGRYLKRRVLGCHGRYWLAQLAHTASATEVNTQLSKGGLPARRAWLFLAWCRLVRQCDFNPQAGLHIRSIRFAVAGDIPHWVAPLGDDRPPERHHDFVRLWIARWISAAGLLAFWHAVDGVVPKEVAADIAILDRKLWEMHRDLSWGLGINVNHALLLCQDRLPRPLGQQGASAEQGWALTARLDDTAPQ